MAADHERVGGEVAPESFRGTLGASLVPGAGRAPQDAPVHNPIESMFSLVRHSESNVKRTRGSRMLQRWLGTVLRSCVGRFKRVKGYAGIAQVMATIEAEHAEAPSAQTKKAA